MSSWRTKHLREIGSIPDLFGEFGFEQALEHFYWGDAFDPMGGWGQMYGIQDQPGSFASRLLLTTRPGWTMQEWFDQVDLILKQKFRTSLSAIFTGINIDYEDRRAGLFDFVEMAYSLILMDPKAPAMAQEFATFVDRTFDEESQPYVFRGGKVLSRIPEGLNDLTEAALMPVPDAKYEQIAQRAIAIFRSPASTEGDRFEAVRNLGDALEELRPGIRDVLDHEDEKFLFEILNKFHIRHANASQHTHYDKDIWLPWMFYSFLASLHASASLINRRPPPKKPSGSISNNQLPDRTRAG